MIWLAGASWAVLPVLPGAPACWSAARAAVPIAPLAAAEGIAPAADAPDALGPPEQPASDSPAVSSAPPRVMPRASVSSFAMPLVTAPRAGRLRFGHRAVSARLGT